MSKYSDSMEQNFKNTKRIKELKAELKMLEAKQNKKGVFKTLGESTKHVFRSLGDAGKKVLTPAGSEPMDLDKLINSLPA